MNVKYFLLAILLLITSRSIAEPLTILIPGGQGGGWDMTAREVGQELQRKNPEMRLTYLNLSGAGGGRALEFLNLDENQTKPILMVQSAPLILRNLSGSIHLGYRNTTPIATLITEYQVIAVKTDSPYQNLNDWIEALRSDPARHPIIGGSPKGSLDHITAALLLQKADIDMSLLRYSPSDGGGNALDKLRRGIAPALVTGLGEVVAAWQSGQIRILGVTSEQRLYGYDIATMEEQGYDLVFANWRGFFAQPGLSAQQKEHYVQQLTELSESEKWHNTLKTYGWSPFLLSGESLDSFLSDQEAQMRAVLQQLDME